MTSKQVFEFALVELNKKDAPSLLLEDYNYFINKAANQYINRMYNGYDVNQQKTDDLRVLKSSAILTPQMATEWSASNLLDKTFEVNLPDDYLHILNCVVEYTVLKNYKCYNQGSLWQQGAKRVTADMWGQLIHNYYLRPSYKQPYYYINNVNVSNVFPTSDNQEDVSATADVIYRYVISGVPTMGETITIGATTLTFNVPPGGTVIPPTLGAVNTYFEEDGYLDVSMEFSESTNTLTIYSPDPIVITTTDSELTIVSKKFGQDAVEVQRSAEVRYGNKSKVRMEIRYGKDIGTFLLSKVYIDYLKTPQFIRLTQEEIDEVEDKSQVLEFPDYVCQEIVNELVKLLMENASDPRLQTNIPVSQSIASPQQDSPTRR